ncbi:MAG: heme ABC transporter ATP-binding protein [Deltaproteobacteria bacterium]|nr:MAG: heme ABC transporter ATP-binding protein [Deltaproteobacteria bacterium]RLC17865.1 MAG: heme ABC transporter ATP-binding protein [Deltaproteobacteria bacterium]
MKKIEHLEMVDISKAFNGIPANDRIRLSVGSGEILGLLGENGAGKTTLMNILYGLYQPDSGDIRINGEPVKIRSPLESIQLGIGMVHQHFMLIQNHTAGENIALGYKQTPFFFPQKKINDSIVHFSRKFNLVIDPQKKVWQLSAGEQQRIEIIKTLFNGADLLILDEPTSVLTPQEIKDLFVILEKMKAEGHLIILISHKLDEIMMLCDRVTVLSKGKVVGNADTKDVDKKTLARMMIGRDVLFNIEKEEMPKSREVLKVSHLCVVGDKGSPMVKDISFNIYQNEIFGIAGVSGNGQRELVEAITGLRKSGTGSVHINGRDITNVSPRVAYDSGISHVPEERIKFGIAPGLYLYENAILKQHHLDKYTKHKFLAYKSVKNHASRLVKTFQIMAPSIQVQTKNLSGGNIQKLILGREISESPPLLVASHPTYGLDVGATEYLRKQLLKRRKEGGAVLLVSEDLEEIFELCDRIAVIFQGEFMGILNANDSRLADMGMMMTGATRIEPTLYPSVCNDGI